MTSATTNAFIYDAIERAVQARVREVIASEVEAAGKRIEDRIKREADSIALSVMAEYDISQDGTVVTIKVRKGAAE